jgi:nuclear pore complex protein Nup210
MAAFNGCYSWLNSHPAYIEVDEVKSESHPECANIVHVSSLQTRESKQAVWLRARDLRTRQTLTAEVKVAKIDRLEIFSRFRQINKGDNQHIEVRAYDDEGNQFSSLEGFKFDWAILDGHDNVMRISPKEAGHTKTHTHPYDVAWLNDDDFFLKARQSGHTQLKVAINEPGYEKVRPAFINLTIVEPFVIAPESGDLGTTPYILPNSEFHFKLQHLTLTESNGVHFADINIPSEKFKWLLVSAGKTEFG